MKVIVGTRGSKLSLAQTSLIEKALIEKVPGLEIEVKVIKTIGDELRDKPIQSIKEIGIFEKEIDKAISQGMVDFAVHSMKDIPIIQPSNTKIFAVFERGSAHDVLISKNKLKLDNLSKNCVIGTGSIRRKAQIAHIRPELKVKSIRGNIDTRLRKFKEGEYEALILAEAGLKRLGMEEYISERLSIEDFTPMPGQGALAIVAREDDNKIISILNTINHEPTCISQLAERAFLKELGIGCKNPIGAFAKVKENQLNIRACAFSFDGKNKIMDSIIGSLKNPEDLGKKIAVKIRDLGASTIFKN